MIDLPKSLRARMARVTGERWRRLMARFKSDRASVVHELRRRGLPSAHIAKLLGLSPQYIKQEYPAPQNGSEP